MQNANFKYFNFIKILCLFLFPLEQSLFAQQPAIHTPTLIPANPTASSQIKIVTHLETLYSAFLVDKFHSVNLSQKHLNLHLCYANGMSPVISHHIDTFAIGQLPSGIYSVELEAYISSAGQHCARVDSNFTSFTFTVGGTTDINESHYNKDVRFFPNPASDHIVIETGLNKIANIYSMQGQLILTARPGSKGEVSLDGIKPGIYLLEITSDDNKSVYRLIIE